ncbi:hypothetical protein N7517_004655 [Penicillium concentricum]|uniref:Uncharacterized protein n=1 Tax=Penicillium concentricum TaxID=293559 RepID=A0A9W9S8N1_9EURO|nr:uncharacterized protein N7517_004655 [Penicillium concentricum]KAJ5372649.1 hypothetical protein N7517_004655 [Penicillium concentricum]
MDDDEFWFMVNDFLNSPLVECVTFNRGFEDKTWLRENPDRLEMSAESSTGEILQSSSSNMVKRESDEWELTVEAEATAGEMLPPIQPGSGPVLRNEDRPLDTLGSHWFEHKGVLFQVFIDISAYFESPVEI